MQHPSLPLFSGTGVALITPFRADGSIDFPALSRVIDHVIQGGVDYVVSLGTTGEAITLSKAECREVLTHTVEKVAGRCPVVAGFFGRNYTAKLVEEVQEYDFSGVAGIMSSSPAYNKPTQAGIREHYLRLADVSPIPVIIYNVPSRTGSNVHPETVLALAEESEVFCAVKEASGNLDQAMQIMKHRPDRFGVLCGDDSMSVAMIASGGHGAISVIANLFPRQFSDMIKASLRGDYATARARNFDMLDVHPYLYAEGNPVGIKAAMAWAGLCDNHLRVPLVPMSDEGQHKLIGALERVPRAVMA